MGEELGAGDVWSALLRAGQSRIVDDESVEHSIHVLNERGEAEVVDWTLPELASSNPWHREIAARVLGRHGYIVGRPYGARVMPALAAAARVESDDEVRCAMVVAMGQAEDPAWIEELLTYAIDPYAPIRDAIAACLPSMCAGQHMNPKSVGVLIALSQDLDPSVRESATRSLGRQTDQNSTAVRVALRALLDDEAGEDFTTTGEAAVGLALRRDMTVYPYLEQWLGRPSSEVDNLVVEAAGTLGDERLLPALEALYDAGWHLFDPRPGVLFGAIAALERHAAALEH